MTEDELPCENCGQNPARRSDQERRRGKPDDPWMIVCEACDKELDGSVPMRPGYRRLRGKELPEAFGPDAAKRRVKWFAMELRVDAAIVARINKTKIPDSFAWMGDIPDDTLTQLRTEIEKIKRDHGYQAYTPEGFKNLGIAMEKYASILGTYQLMSGVAGFTGIKPAEKALNG